MEKTRLSTKGQIILPKAIRTARDWGTGTEFTIEETKEGILLRPARPFPETKVEDVFGCLKTNRKKPATPAEMDAAIMAEISERHARGRY